MNKPGAFEHRIRCVVFLLARLEKRGYSETATAVRRQHMYLKLPKETLKTCCRAQVGEIIPIKCLHGSSPVTLAAWLLLSPQSHVPPSLLPRPWHKVPRKRSTTELLGSKEARGRRPGQGRGAGPAWGPAWSMAKCPSGPFRVEVLCLQRPVAPPSSPLTPPSTQALCLTPWEQ